MQDIHAQLSGVFAPMTTPFRDDLLDLESLAGNVERMNRSGLRGYFVLGTNGEFKALGIEERWQVLQAVVRHRGSGMVVMAGCGAESTHETLELSRRAADLGADLASLLMPSFFAKKMTVEVMERYVREVADASPLPVVLYNNPGVAAGVAIRAELLRRVADHPRVVGIKDSSKETFRENLAAASPRFRVLAGSAAFFLELLRAGGTGGVLSLANVVPEECVRLYRAHLDGNTGEADRLNATLVELNARVSGSFGVAGVKAAMDLAGYAGGEPRRPHAGLKPEEREQVRAALQASGFLPGGFLR
jgi:4-hydroxy-2-oxoglutarate aldolase